MPLVLADLRAGQDFDLTLAARLEAVEGAREFLLVEVTALEGAPEYPPRPVDAAIHGLAATLQRGKAVFAWITHTQSSRGYIIDLRGRVRSILIKRPRRCVMLKEPMLHSLLDVLQIADSSFPSGGYAHSFGLEALYARGDVDLEGHLRFVLGNGLARLELPVVRKAFSATGVDELAGLDALMDVLLPVREFRVASRSVGRSFLRAAANVHIQEGALKERGIEHHAVVFGAVLCDWQIDLDDGVGVYAWQALRQQLSAAQRLGKIGQSAVQDLLHRLKPAVRAAIETSRSMDAHELGVFSPWLDLAGMAHEQQFSRLFLS